METGERKYKNILDHFVKCTMGKNLFQNGIMVLAVALVTLLMTIMFGAGIGTIQNIQTAELRIKGSTANGFLMGVTDRNITDSLDKLDYVSTPGIQEFVGEVIGIQDIGVTQSVIMTSYSETEWNSHILPTVTDVQGNYPKEMNDIMLSQWTLQKLGIEEPQTQMTITIPFATLEGEEVKQDFILSGWYRDYLKVDTTSGNTLAAEYYYANQGLNRTPVGNVIVSEAFAEQYVVKEGRIAAFIVDKKLNADEAIDMLSADLGMKDIMVAGLTKDFASAVTIMVLPVLLIILVIICGYLLVYNIMNISILRDMHMFGQLKTLGATSRQIKTIVRKQARLLCLIGIPAGLLFGLFLSRVILPGLLKSILSEGRYGYAMTYEVSISPLICLFAIVFTYFTVLISCTKPAGMAGKVSPIEALRYTESTGSMKEHHTSNGGKVYRMAFRNVFRSKKRAFVTLLSLFMGMFLFLVINVALYDIDYEKKYEREMPDNFILTNLSYQTEDYAGLVNFFEENTVREIEGWDGVEEVVCEYAEPVLITQGQDTLSLYLEDQAAYAGETQDRGEVFCGVASGLTTERLMGFTYQSTLSEEEVRSLLDSGRGIFLPAKEGADAQELTGREIILTYGKQPPKAAAYTIAGILDWPDGLVYNENFSNFGYIYGRKATVMYMSEEGIRRIAQTPTVMNLKLDSTTYKDQEIQNKLEAQFGDNVQIKIDSQLKIRASAYDSVDAIKKAGMIFSLFLLFMGIVNFINVIFTSIYSRKKEIAAMESIGMTQGQLKKMLIMEGVYYSVITMGLLMTVGLVLSYGVVQLVKSIVYFASFGVPVGMLAAIFLVMLALCAAIPLTVFHQITKESIVERLRKGED